MIQKHRFSPIFAARLCCHGVFIHRLQHFQHLGRHPAYESQDFWLGQVHRICFRWCCAEGKDVPLSNPLFFSTVLRFDIIIRVSIQGLLPVTVRVKLTWPHEIILFTFNIIYDHHIAYIYNCCEKHWSEKNFTEWACRDHSSTGKCIGEGICRGTTTIASKQWLSQRPYFSIKGLCWVERFGDLISSWWHVKGPRTTGLRWVTSWEHCSWCWRCLSSKVFVWQSSLWKIQIKHSGAKISHGLYQGKTRSIYHQSGLKAHFGALQKSSSIILTSSASLRIGFVNVLWHGEDAKNCREDFAEYGQRRCTDCFLDLYQSEQRMQTFVASENTT